MGHPRGSIQKKIKDNNRSTGKGVMRFQFYAELENLLGEKHDIDYPVAGTAEGVEIRRPDAVGLHDEDSTKEVPTLQPCQPTPHRWRGRAEEGPLLGFLRESESASQTRPEELLGQMKSSQESFQKMMSAFLENPCSLF